MASAVFHPEDQLDGGLTFMRPLPGVAPLAMEDSTPRSPTVGAPSHSQLISTLFPQSAEGESPSQVSVTGLEIGHFVLEERIGRGGMGAVFRALDRGLDRVVALKVLSPEQTADPASIQRFHNEARAAAQLDHNNIARVYFIGRDRGIHFIAFEFVVGTTIRELIVQRGRLGVGDAVNFTLQIADALRHTAAAEVVHRDIKPSNIIITPSGRAKLVDLGLARQIHGRGEELTVAGTALGTFDYIAPEQAIDARNVDIRSDIYSLGCTLYHMLTGEPPYPRGSMFEKVMNHHRASPPNPCIKNDAVPAVLGAIVQKMMATDPDERFATPDQLCQELAALGVNMGLKPTSLESPAWTPQVSYQPVRGSWDGLYTWLIVATILVGAVIAVDQFPWDRRSSSRESSRPLASDAPERSGQGNVAVVEADGTEPPLRPSPGTAVPTQPTPFENGLAVAGVGSVESPSSVGTGISTPISDSISSSKIPEIPPRPGDYGPPLPEGTPTDADPQELLNTLRADVVDTIGRLSQGINQIGIRVPPPMQSSESGSVVTTPIAAGPREPNVGMALTPANIETIPPGPADAAASTEPFHVISAKGTKTGYQTLAEACFNADDGAIIELRFDGRLSRQQPPLKITRKRITLRPAEGFRPILSFAHDNAALPAGKSVSMITLGGSALEVYNVDIEMRVDSRAIVDRWSLISCTGTSELEVFGTSLTLINPENLPAAFVDLPLREGSVDAMPDKMYRDPLTLRFINSIIRGQGDLVSQRNTEPMQLQLLNVAVAISGVGLRQSGEDVFSMTMHEEEVSIDVEMQHVTLISGEGLLSADSGDHGQFLPSKFSVRDCVFSVLTPDQPLISLTGHEEFDELQGRFTWTRGRDSNFFELTGPMWRIYAPLSAFNVRQDFPFVDWSEYWGQASDHQILTGLLNNARLETGDRIHHFERSDFTLRPSTIVGNPAIGAASDRRDSGVDWTQNQLPQRFPTLLSTDR